MISPLKTMCLNHHCMNVVMVIALVDTLLERLHLQTVMTLAIPQISKMKVMLMQVNINFIIGAVELNVVSGHTVDSG